MQVSMQLMQDWQNLGVPGLALLALVFLVGSFIFIPRPPLCFLAGLVFGFVAFPIALIATTVGAMLAFLLSRHLCQSFFLRKIESRPVWKAVVEAIDAEGWKIVGMLRLASPVPGTVTNYLIGLTRIGTVPYTLATLLGLAPQILLFTYLGMIGQLAFQNPIASPLRTPLLIAGLILTAIVVVLVTRRTKGILAKRSIM